MKTTSIALCLFLIVTAGLVGVSRRIEAAPQTTDSVPTFARDVAPILYANCVTCHRPGEIGPMSLISYQDVRPWARSIAEESRRRCHAALACGCAHRDILERATTDCR
jgi:hypothetical protein